MAYIPTIWQLGDIITQDKMNKIENGLAEVSQIAETTGGQGPKGDPGPIGPQGPQGPEGPVGKSAYQIAVDNGFAGTEQEWLQSLSMEGIKIQIVSALPTTGEEKTLYFVAQSSGTNHDEYMWINGKWELIGDTSIDLSDYYTKTEVDEAISNISLTAGPKGDTGDTGPKGDTGPAGADGLTTSISVNGTTYTQVNGKITLPDYPTVGKGVDSFKGRTGAVTPANGDYTADMVGARPSDWLPSPEEIDAVSSTTVSAIASMTQTEYDALTEKVATVLYVIKE